MRPIVDLNNLSYSKETKIYYSRTIILIRILILLLLAGTLIYYLIENDYLSLLIAGSIFLFQIPYLIKSIKRMNEIQFLINSIGIQYRGQMLEPWDNIENERIVNEYINNDQGYIDYLIYYIKDSGQVMKFDIREFGVGTRELKHALTIHRGRFENERAAKI
ncbi:hypothetical protein ACFSJW_17600 [Flavobacterium artemisiae]|uniref:YcxB-like protein n=1 Tax=Flavobacterium artemisiae TaxID=2126556 RepID=A0ABW4H984_9FLAO